MLMNFLGTHDTERILTILADVGPEPVKRRARGYKLPAARELAVRR